MKFSRVRRQFSIFVIDSLILFLNIFFTLVLRNTEIPAFSYVLLHLRYLILPFCVTITLMYISNMYNLTVSFSFGGILAKIFFACSVGMLVATAVFYVVPDSPISPKTFLLLHTFLSVFLLTVWRSLFDTLFFKLYKSQQFIVFGYNNNVQELLESTKKKTYINFRPVALFNAAAVEGLDVPVISTLKELQALVEENGVNHFVLSISQDLPDEIKKYLFSRIGKDGHFYSIPDFMDQVCRKIPLGSINEPWIMQNIILDGRLFLNFVKRLFDIIFSVLLLVISGIFWPLFAIIIKSESKGPVFFKQVREGRNGKEFTLYKFRTMRTENNTFAMTAQNDNRITKFGNFMRKTRIDELPQLLNVLKGDMSVIGPRPERPELAVQLEKEVLFYRTRLLVKPGITGWDQVSGEYHSPSAEDTYKKVQFDIYYIKHQSIFLDLSILAKTIVTVVKKAGR